MQPDPTPDLEELEAMEKAATPGPWRMQTRHDQPDHAMLMLVPVVRAPWPDLPHGSITVARCGNGNAGTYSGRPTHIREREQGNAALIAAARNALPFLLRAARELDEMREERDKYAYCARQFCGAHVGVSQARCPVCERDELRVRVAEMRAEDEMWKANAPDMARVVREQPPKETT